VKIGIIGYGYVGKGIERMFEARADWVAVIDPAQKRDDRTRMAEADIIFVCVPTPRKDGGDMCDTSIVESVVAEWAAHCASSRVLMCIKSTVPPGTTERLIKLYGDHVHFSPEYMGEGGNYVDARYPDPRNAMSHPFCIVGGHRADQVLAYFQRVMATSARYVATTATAAELAKYMENAYLATKVAFCNEFASIADAHGVPYNTLRDLWLCDPRVDPSHTLVFPNQRGFNGKCLPKDLAAIRMAAFIAGTMTPLLDSVAYYDMGGV
jgi:UDPglucose 6-dehydrogenase